MRVKGWGFGANETVLITFVDSGTGTSELATLQTDGTGAFTIQVTIPLDASAGDQMIKAKATGSGQVAKHTLTVT